ncbi:DNA repair protein XRCC1-like [Patiria miniata]|uniref:DNA repair protein XRCC1 n=1 Tax=Patiria miniata TaxID=46514 RepID=A0A914AQ54_PATMI|nr:DNA repair protein XRCC1-like [Patiria miniata]
MPVIKLQHVVSCSSEDTTHKADNLLKPESYRKWKCAENAKRHASVILQFEKASQIHSIDVGNESSAFVEILVGHSTSTALDDYQVVLVTSSFMSPMDSKNGINTNRVRMFGPDKLSKAVADKKWDRAKIVCSQPFNKFLSYGLSFVKFHAPPTEEETSSGQHGQQSQQTTSKLGMFKLKEDAKASSISPGSFFKSRSSIKADPAPLTGAAAVRAAATVAAASLTSSVTTSQATTASTASNQTQQRAPKTTPSTTTHRQSDTRSDTPQKTTQKRRLSDEDEAPSKRADSKVAAGRRNDADKEKGRSKAPPPMKSREEAPKKPKSKPFERLMEGVTFVLSGFQNPLRGDLREKAMEMGAKYRPDWGPGCTHLICAFANTPKFNQVKNKGKIVTKGWILDSYKKKSLHPWRRYSMVTESDDDGSSYEEESETDEEDDWEPPRRKKPSPQKATPSKAMPKNATPKKATPKKATPKDAGDGNNSDQGTSEAAQRTKPSKPDVEGDDDCSTTDIDSDTENVVRRAAASKQHDDVSSGGDTEDELRRIREKGATDAKAAAKDNYDSSTDEETYIPTSSKPEGATPSLNDIPDLPDFFADKIFFLYGKFDAEERRQISRLIVTFEGTVEDYMTDEVSYVITNSEWDADFDKALSDHPGLSFVRPKWIYVCSEKSKMVPYQPYIVVPS